MTAAIFKTELVNYCVIGQGSDATRNGVRQKIAMNEMLSLCSGWTGTQSMVDGFM